MHFPSDGELALRLVLALVLGGLIGLERELSDHPAGLRTHIGVAMGAALFGILSGYGFRGFDASRSVTNFQVDPTRVASQIVVGVGFLGGGAILKHGATVRGLTTASSLWVTAAIGLGCALGAYRPTLLATGLMLLTLVLLRTPGRWLNQRVRARETVLVHLRSGSDPSAVLRALSDIEGVTVRSLSVREVEDECMVQADLLGDRGVDLETKLGPVADLDEVETLEVT
ncbi:MAG: putative Mg2+ transporter-C (MgtC) family protein [Actinomycetota bacterium]|jgi:putative Mg2+ transporter-C (MgtC) family protein